MASKGGGVLRSGSFSQCPFLSRNKLLRLFFWEGSNLDVLPVSSLSTAASLPLLLISCLWSLGLHTSLWPLFSMHLISIGVGYFSEHLCPAPCFENHLCPLICLPSPSTVATAQMTPGEVLTPSPFAASLQVLPFPKVWHCGPESHFSSLSWSRRICSPLWVPANAILILD